MNLPTKGLQYTQNTQGGWAVDQMPNTATFTVADVEPVRDWLAELELPKDWAKLETLAQPQRGMSTRRLRFILADESLTIMPGIQRFKPKQWVFFPGESYCFTLAHLGFVIGTVDSIWRAKPEELEQNTVEGAAILAEATLYDSPLADAAWRGIQLGIFGHACGVVRMWRAPLPDGGEFAKDELLEVALTDRPGCPNARIIRTWQMEGAR